MSSGKTMELAALGRSSYLGQFYDAREERFVQGALFTTFDMPKECVHSVDIDFNNSSFTSDNSYSTRFDKLSVSAELKMSIMSGMVNLEGSAKYLKEDKASSRSVKCTLIYNVIKKNDKINIYDSKLKDYVSLEALRRTKATHFVGGITWGANTLATFEMKNVSKSDQMKVHGDLSVHINKVSFVISGKGEVEFDQTSIDQSKDFSMTFYGDVVPDGEYLPQTMKQALELIKKIPDYIKNSNNGKGKQLSFELYPLDEVLGYFKLELKSDLIVKQLSLQSVKRVDYFFDDLLRVQGELNDLATDVTSNSAVCIPRESIEKIVEYQQGFVLAETNFRNDLRKCLLAIRNNKVEDNAIENVIVKFGSGLFSPQKARAFIQGEFEVQAKLLWYAELLKKGVGYGRGQSLDNIILKENEFYVFLFPDYKKFRSQELWFQNYQLFIALLGEKETSSADADGRVSFYIFETGKNIGKNLEEDICIHRYVEGTRVSKNILYEKVQSDKLSLVKYESKIELVAYKPNKRSFLVTRCPGSLEDGKCGVQEVPWNCEKCHQRVEYGYDNFYYCDCGKVDCVSSTYKCRNKEHGTDYLEFKDAKNLYKLLEKMKPREEMNYLILGETGVGKSTFINAFANYLTFDSLANAENSNIICLIPTSFTITDENYEEKLITLGKDDDNEKGGIGESRTQSCRAYSFPIDDKIVRLIDTPGIGDTKGIEQDRVNFANILSFISNYDYLNGICILLKPNNSRLTVVFRFCIQELLTHLHRNSSENIVFVFTHARSTLFRPGDTLPPLRRMLKEIEKKEPYVEITLNSRTIYCVDNESFRFLAALRNGIIFTEEERGNFEASWTKSASDCNKMMKHVSQLKPHQVHDTISLNESRRIIVCLSKPIGDITQNIQLNLAMLKEQRNKIERAGEDIELLKKALKIPVIDLEPVHFDQPRTVCASPSCYKLFTIDEVSKIDYVQVCHNPCHLENVAAELLNNPQLRECSAMAGTNNCRHCGCSFEKHMHIYYENKQVIKEKVDSQVQNEIAEKVKRKETVEKVIAEMRRRKRDLKKEQAAITKASAKFAYFLKSNAITPYNDALKDYLIHLIAVEKNQADKDPDRKEMVKKLHKMKLDYQAEVEILSESLSSSNDPNGLQVLTAGTITKIVSELYSLPINGPVIRKMMEELNKSKQREIAANRETFFDPKSTGKTKGQGWFKKVLHALNVEL